MSSHVFKQFETIGRDLFVSRLISSHGGNLSIREDDVIFITRSGCQLAHLKPNDIVTVSAAMRDDADEHASSELVVHRAIYAARETAHQETTGAIVHAHALHTTAQTLLHARDVIEPLDSEAQLLIPQVPVVEAKQTIGSLEAAEKLAAALSQNSTQATVAVLRTHGPFAWGATLEDAYRLVSVLEHSCELLDIIERRA